MADPLIAAMDGVPVGTWMGTNDATPIAQPLTADEIKHYDLDSIGKWTGVWYMTERRRTHWVKHARQLEEEYNGRAAMYGYGNRGYHAQ